MKFQFWREQISKKLQKTADRIKSKRALLGVDAGILIAFFTITMLVIYLAAPIIMSTLFDIIIGGPQGIYSYLIELPLIAEPPNTGGTIGQQLGIPMVRVFGLMQTIALAMFAVVLIVAAICYALENFRVVSEGTAANIIMNSVFTLILIFACQYIYNAAAGAINIFTGWPDVGGSGLLIPSNNAIDILVGYATGGIGTVPLPNLDPFTGFFFSGILIMLVASILMLTLVMGITRLFFAGVLAAVLPLLLVLRLIPFTKHFADTLIQDLIGFMFASIMASIVLLFGYQILISTSLNPLTQILIAIITLFAAAYMSTTFAGKFGALGMSAANVIGGAVSSAAGAAMGLAGGALLGGGAGMTSRLSSLRGKGLSKTEMLGQAGAGFVSGATPGAVSGFFGGGIGGGGGGMRMTSMGRGGGMRGMGYMVVGTMNRQKAPAQEFLANRAGSTLTAAMYKNSTGDVLPTATPEASAFFMEELNKKSSEDIYNGYVATNYPEIAENLKDTRAAGSEVKRHLQTLPSEIAYSNWQRAQNHKSLPKEGRTTFYQNARDQIGENRETVTAIQKGIYTPNLEALDTFPRFALDTFNVGTVTQKGAVANAKLFAAVKQLDPPKNPRSISYLAENEFRKASPNVLGQKLSHAAGVKMTEKEQNTYGYAMTKVRDVVVKRNPTLANNIAHYTMGNGKNQLTYLMNDEKFTEKALKDMESHETSAWLTNTLNLKQRKEFSVENIFKIKQNQTVDTENRSTRNTPLQVISPPKQPTKTKPVDLLTMQKTGGEGEKQQW
ncbi:MAG: hypothetical protein FWG55_04930 [Candidatus Bathyarchaeota archaeon]|nr:hypothetical protein [Candidatus Termiticorpusculum sp.]